MDIRAMSYDVSGIVVATAGSQRGVTLGNNFDMFLTSGNRIYHYSDAGEELNSYTFTGF